MFLTTSNTLLSVLIVGCPVGVLVLLRTPKKKVARGKHNMINNWGGHRWAPQREAIWGMVEDGQRRCAFMEAGSQLVCCGRVVPECGWHCAAHPAFASAESEAVARGCDLWWAEVEARRRAVSGVLTRHVPGVLAAVVQTYLPKHEGDLGSTEHVDAYDFNLFQFHLQRERNQRARILVI